MSGETGSIRWRRLDSPGHESARIVAEESVWRLIGSPCRELRPVVSGCIDLDLNFSPSTNLLPIRRLNLSVGQQATVRAAWLRFPSFALEPLDQLYRRVGESSYRYESASGKFVATGLARR